MATTKTVTALFRDLDAKMDAKAFDELERTAPDVIDVIRQMVAAGVGERGILQYMIRKFPHRWIEAQTIRQVARHLEREM